MSIVYASVVIIPMNGCWFFLLFCKQFLCINYLKIDLNFMTLLYIFCKFSFKMSVFNPFAYYFLVKIKCF